VGDPVVTPRACGWKQFANCMLIEQPLSVKLSFGKKKKEVPKTPEMGTPIARTFSATVSDNYAKKVNDSYAPVVQELLEEHGHPVLVISGLNDAKDCNFLGTGAWLDLLDGEAATRFMAASLSGCQAPTQAPT
jgi:hypothetical protein